MLRCGTEHVCTHLFPLLVILVKQKVDVFTAQIVLVACLINHNSVAEGSLQ